MKKWSVIIPLTMMMFWFQNCGELPATHLNSQTEHKGELTEESLGLDSDESSVPATLFRALSQAKNKGLEIEQLNREKGFDLLLQDHLSWIRCNLDTGGGDGDMMGAMVLTYGCFASQLSFEESSHPLSLSGAIYSALEDLYKTQQSHPEYAQTIIKNDQSYLISDQSGSLICASSDGTYLCEYIKN